MGPFLNILNEKNYVGKKKLQHGTKDCDSNLKNNYDNNLKLPNMETSQFY